MTQEEEIYHRFVNYEWNKVSDNLKESILKAISEALKQGNKNSISPVVSVSVFECPVCGKDWDTDKHNSCSCGAYIGKH